MTRFELYAIFPNIVIRYITSYSCSIVLITHNEISSIKCFRLNNKWGIILIFSPWNPKTVDYIYRTGREANISNILPYSFYISSFKNNSKYWIVGFFTTNCFLRRLAIAAASKLSLLLNPDLDFGSVVPPQSRLLSSQVCYGQ